jgi:hypothetical protein
MKKLVASLTTPLIEAFITAGGEEQGHLYVFVSGQALQKNQP